MNSCILMAEITQDPQLRYTQDNQMAIAEMTVQFAGLRPEDPPSTVKAIGWGNLAQDIQQKYHAGDNVVIEGRLGMKSVDRPEGFKEKQAELTISKIYPLTGLGASSVSQPAGQPAAQPMGQSAGQPIGGDLSTPIYSAPAAAPASKPAAASKAKKAPAPVAEPDFDDIPF
jgi:single-strand DNA-binding protein